MSHSTISLGLGLGGGKSATSSGSPGGGGAFANTLSCEFDPTAKERLTVPTDSSLNTTGSISLSAWVYPDVIDLGYRAIAAKRTSVNDWQFAVTSGKLQLYLFNSGVTSTTGSTNLTAGAWHHVAFTVEVATNGAKLYLNGNVDATTTPTSTSSNGAAGITIGNNKNADTPARFWDGKIDEVAWFHSALSASDISTLRGGVAAGTLGQPADISSLNPVGWWRMGDNNSASAGSNVPLITDAVTGTNNAVQATASKQPILSTDVA